MPSCVQSSKWFVRVDGPYEFLLNKFVEVTGWMDMSSVLALYHVGEKKENPHCHFVIELTSVLQKQSFDKRIKKVFDVQKSTSYSSKVWDGADAACSYMFHESDVKILCNKGHSQEDIDKYKVQNEKVQAVVEVNKERAPGRKVERVVERLCNDNPTRHEIGKIFLEMIRDGEMYEPGNFQLARMIEEVYLKTRTADQWNGYVEDRLHTILYR